jgi:hypothetical protein
LWFPDLNSTNIYFIFEPNDKVLSTGFNAFRQTLIRINLRNFEFSDESIFYDKAYRSVSTIVRFSFAEKVRK